MSYDFDNDRVLNHLCFACFADTNIPDHEAGCPLSLSVVDTPRFRTLMQRSL